MRFKSFHINCGVFIKYHNNDRNNFLCLIIDKVIYKVKFHSIPFLNSHKALEQNFPQLFHFLLVLMKNLGFNQVKIDV